MSDLKISSADTLDGTMLLIELTDGRTLEFSLDQILTLVPRATFAREEEPADEPKTGETGQSDAN